MSDTPVELKKAEPQKWYAGAKNDACFIINTPPRPSNDVVWHETPHGPSMVLACQELTPDKCQAIIDQHNNEIETGARHFAAADEMRGQALLELGLMQNERDSLITNAAYHEEAYKNAQTYIEKLRVDVASACDSHSAAVQNRNEWMDKASALERENTALKEQRDRMREALEYVRPLHDATRTVGKLIAAALTATEPPESKWQPIESAPEQEGVPFLVLCPKNDVADFVIVQVSKFQGDMYPDFLNANIDYADRITNALAWTPTLPTIATAGNGGEG